MAEFSFGVIGLSRVGARTGLDIAPLEQRRPLGAQSPQAYPSRSVTGYFTAHASDHASDFFQRGFSDLSSPGLPAIPVSGGERRHLGKFAGLAMSRLRSGK